MTDNIRFSLLTDSISPPPTIELTEQHRAVARLATGTASTHLYPYPFRTFHQSWFAAPGGRLMQNALEAETWPVRGQ